MATHSGRRAVGAEGGRVPARGCSAQLQDPSPAHARAPREAVQGPLTCCCRESESPGLPRAPSVERMMRLRHPRAKGNRVQTGALQAEALTSKGRATA